MRPKANKLDVPSSHDVSVYIHNSCVEWLKKLKGDILVSAKKAYQGIEHSWTDFRQLPGRYQARQMDGPRTIQRRRFWG
jgi:hypothetical protein